MSAPALLALLCLAQAAPPAGVEARGDALTVIPSTREMQFHRNAELRDGKRVLRADEIDYDPTGGHARALGRVLFADGLLGGIALRLDVDLQTQAGTFLGATLFQKGHTTPEAVAAARTPPEMRLVGRNELTLRADVVQRLSEQSFEAWGVYLTPCDCAGPGWLTEPPSWSVRARHARISPGQSARLTWATLYIKDVPVLPVPLLFLPLSNRQTGFLLPRPNYTSLNGFQIEEPFFWAIHRSWDVTFTPGYFFGETHGNAADPGSNYGMRGPRLASELRYAPSLGTTGKLDLGLVEDLKPEEGKAHRGLRGDLSWSHVQALGAGFSDRIDVMALSDQRYFYDTTADVIAVQQSYLRSDARVDHRSVNTDAYLTASYYQALSGTPQVPGTLQPFFGPNDVNRDTFQRLPAFAFSAQEVGLGPLRFSGQVDGTRYAPLGSREPLPCAAGDLACAFAQTRTVEERVGIQPELRLPVKLGRFAELAPYAIVRADAWHVEDASGTDLARAFPVLGATLQTELARTFGPADGVRYRHVITPVVEVRGMPGALGRGPDLPDDELDAPLARPLVPGVSAGAWPIAGSSGETLPSMLQGVAAVRTRLDRKEGSAVSEPVRAELGQGYDLLNKQAGDTFADVALQLGPFAAAAALRYGLGERRMTLISGHASWTTPTGSSISLGYTRLRASLTDPMRAGLFDLVGPPAPASDDGNYAERFDVGAHWRASNALAFDLGLTFLPHATSLAAFSKAGATSGISPLWERLMSYSAGVSYGSPCNCWGLKLGAIFQPALNVGRPFAPASFFFVLDAQRIGGNLGG